MEIIFTRFAHFFGYSHEQEEEKYRRGILLMLTLLTALAVPPYSLIYAWAGSYWPLLGALLYLAFCVLNLLVYRLSRRFAAFRVRQLVGIAAAPLICHLTIGSFEASSGIIMAGLLAPLGALMFASDRQANAFFGLFLLFLGIALAWDQLAGVIPVQVPTGVRYVLYFFNFAAVSFISYYLLSAFVQDNERFKRQLKAQNAVIEAEKRYSDSQKAIVEKKNREILESINYAKRIQSTILPSPGLVRAFLPDSFVLYLPKDIVAGDFYWLHAEGHLVFFAAADCTGHGVPGAMVSLLCHHALNRTVREYGLTRPGEILDKTREILLAELSKNQEDIKDGMDISLCVLDYSKPGEVPGLLWAGANNPLLLVRNGDMQLFKPDKQPVGLYPKQAPFTTQEIELAVGDSLYLFTDGLQDQFGGPKGRKLGSAGLREQLQQASALPMEAQRAHLLRFFDQWKEAEEQIDDVCLIGLKV